MTSTASQAKAPEAPSPKSDIAIIGAGVAGLTCALRLSQRGYKVTLYERDTVLGGNLSSVLHKDMYHDVYTHLFCDWYVNFWNIVENDLKITREQAFEARLGVKILDPTNGGAPRYIELKNPNTLKNILGNLKSGALPPPDMFLVGFTMIDLASQTFRRSITLEQQTVNGFLYSRPYATQDCADLQNTILNEIWSISSNDTSAAAYRDFIKHSLGSRGLPFAWLLRGSLEEMLIAPWREHLGPNCSVKSGVSVTGIEIGDDEKIHLNLSDKTKATHDNAVLAVPAPELAKLVEAGSAKPAATRQCVVERLPQLSELERLRTANILVVTVVFKNKLQDIPAEHVGLARSRGYLTFIDISQLWTSLNDRKEKQTVLILAASDANDYPSTKDQEWAHLMLQDLARYLPVVKPGSAWGDAESNIDYSRSFPQSNRTHTLFLNDMNSEHLEVEPCYSELPSVFFAGDFCRNEVKMATVESAVLSGLHAARAVQMRVEGKTDIAVEQSVMPSSSEFSAAKLLLLPLAYGALAWSTVNAALRDLAGGQTDTPEEVLTPGTTLALIPLRFAADWVSSLENLAVALLSSTGEPGNLSAASQRVLQAAVQEVSAASAHFASAKSDKASNFASLLTDVLRVLGARASELKAGARTTGQTQPSAPADGGLLRGSGRYRSGSGYVRRHRAKR